MQPKSPSDQEGLKQQQHNANIPQPLVFLEI